MFVILNEVKNLIKSSSYKTEILRLTPQNDIVTHSQGGEDKGEGDLMGSTLTPTLSRQREKRVYWF